MRVYGGGTFDLLHVGHLYALRQMRVLAGDGEVIIGLNSDAFVERFKGHRPVQSYAERAEILSALRLVDRVVLNIGDEDSRIVLEAVMPDIIAVGPDWYDEDRLDQWGRYCVQMGFDQDWLFARRIELHPLRSLPERSSTRLRTIAGGVSQSRTGSLTS